MWLRTITYFICVASVAPIVAHAAPLSYVSNLISTSAPNASVYHVLEFTVTNAVPASGKIVITPEDAAYVIPAGFDYQDMDMLVSTSGPYVDRTLAATAGAAQDGVSVVTGSAGSITITLNSTIGLAAGNAVRILLGTNASFGGGGDTDMTNPSTVQSYRVRLFTRTAGDVQIDYGTAMIAIVHPVTTQALVETVAPIRFNGLPSGTIAHNNAMIEVTLETNEFATCRYATSSNVVYGNMTGSFSNVGGTFHYKVIGGHQNNTSYTYYVRCADFYDVENDDDYPISFTLQPTPALNTSGNGGSGVNSGLPPNSYPAPGTTGLIGPGGTGDEPGGSATLYRSNVVLSGWAAPLSTITVLRDGVLAGTAAARADGVFSVSADAIERGTYTFVTYMTDSAGRVSATYSSTLSLGQGTNNTISNIVLPPTLELSSTKVEAGESVRVFGEGTPGATIELVVTPQSGGILGSAKKYTATASQGVPGVVDGRWEFELSASELSRGTYEVKARTLRSSLAESPFSGVEFLGVGEDPSPDFGLRADINKDGKVNLVDFSIMLSFWSTSNADADINSDGTVNLSDFSVMLFYWTG